jgi:protein TonB
MSSKSFYSNLLVFFLLLAGGSLSAQSSATLQKDSLDDFTPFADKPAEFPGGYVAYTKFLQDSLIYPAEAMKNNIQGTVKLMLYIKADGSIADVRVINDIGGGCAEEAVRVIKKSSPWLPGMIGGKAVNSKITLPILFTFKK